MKIIEYQNYALLGVLGLGVILSYMVSFPAATGLLYMGAVMISGGTAGVIAVWRGAAQRTEQLLLSGIVIGFGVGIASLEWGSWYWLVLGGSLVLWGIVYGLAPSSLAIGDGVVSIGFGLAMVAAVWNQDIALGIVFAAGALYGMWNVAQHATRSLPGLNR